MQPGLVMTFATMGQRVWFAWHCLPRDDRGEPPTLRSLEVAHGLANGTLHKLTWDLLKRPGYERLTKVCEALGVTPEWLQTGRGPGPVASWPVPPRPQPPAGAKAAKKSPSGTRKAATQR